MSNPTPKSPEQVCKDPAYEVMRGYQAGQYYPNSDECVVKHKETGTYWWAVYSVREDDSDFADPARWAQVAPKQVTITKYEPVGGG